MSDLRILCWEGYDTACVLDPFRERHGISVEARTLISDADAAAEVAADEPPGWDVVNINNAYVKKYLDPRGRISRLSESDFADYYERLLPGFERQYAWTRADDGSLIGVCQRFGTFNLVVNERRVSRTEAEDQGFQLANHPALQGRFGILSYEDFNIFHVCLGCDLDPFVSLSSEEEALFERTALRWFRNAAVVTEDHLELNRALVDGRIDFYVSGGVYTASPARLAGHREIYAVTPRHGPMNGRGAIAFTEITSVIAGSQRSGWAEPFLHYLQEPETAVRVAFVDGTCNPVAQMGDERVRARFSAAQLDAIQWDTLEEDMSRCIDYDIVPNHASLLTRLRAAAAAASRV